MIDENTYRYTPMELPNVQCREPIAHAPVPTTTHPALLAIIGRLGKARPNWRLVSTSAVSVPNSPNHARWVTKFIVYEHGEELGRIWRRNYDSGEVICFDNQRLNQKRQRGDCTSTKDAGKAFKLITKEFAPKSVAELLAEARRRTRDLANREVGNRQRMFNNSYYSLRGLLDEFSYANWDSFCTYAQSRGIRESALETFTTSKEDKLVAERVADTISTDADITVVLRGEEYILQAGTGTSILDTDRLSLHLKRNIGMLKLVEDGEYVPNVGVRLDAKTFLVLPEKG